MLLIRALTDMGRHIPPEAVTCEALIEGTITEMALISLGQPRIVVRESESKV